MSRTAMRIWRDSFALEGDKTAKWRYDLGVILKGMEAVWKQNRQQEYFNYIKKMMDFYVDQNGKIKGYRKDEFNIDHVNNGKNILFLYEATGSEHYRKRQSYCAISFDIIPAQDPADSGIRRSIPGRCGWTGFTWDNPSMRNMQNCSTSPKPSMISRVSSY